MASVTVDNVTKRFGHAVAVNDLSLTIRDREFVVLLGPSGCGKTTTLNMIAGLEAPSSGSILFDEHPVENVPAERRNIAMVFQSIALYPHKDVYDNIAFPLRMAGLAKDESDQRVRAAADIMRIGHLLDRRPHELSGGQRQRVALGRAIVRDPAVFLFDEPLSALDAKLRVEMRIEVKKLHERLGATFVYVTHDQVEALTMADRIAVIDGGDLQQFGSPDDVYMRPANTMVAAFIGSPAMNFLSGDLLLQDDVVRIRGEEVDLTLDSQVGGALPTKIDGRVTLGIRPERIQVDGDNPDLIAWAYATEPIGSDLFIDVSFDDPDTTDAKLADPAVPDPVLFKIRTRPEYSVRTGEKVPLSFPGKYIYLFDYRGRRIYPSENSL